MTRSNAAPATRRHVSVLTAGVTIAFLLPSLQAPALSSRSMLEPTPVGLGVSAIGRSEASGSFEENLGQADPAAAFVWTGDGHTALITDHGAVLQRNDRSITLRFLGSSPAPAAGLDVLPGRTGYFIGNDPRAWVTGVRTFQGVRVPSVYPGIDVVWHAAPSGALEYDFHLAPGADPALIRVAVRGGTASVTSGGDLRVAVPGADLLLRRPVAFQHVHGVRRTVGAEHDPRPDGSFGLRLAPYDPRVPLVVDPVLEYSTYLGGELNDWGAAVAAGDDGSTVAVGYSDAAFPVQGGHGDRFNLDVIVTKLAPDGSRVYSVFIGGGVPESIPDPLGLGCDSPLAQTALIPGCGMEVGNGVALDAAGNVYVVGWTTSRGFPVTNAAQEDFGGGTYDGFVAKLSPAGDQLLYSTYLGGIGDDLLESVDVDGGGRSIVVGTSGSIDFPTENPAQPGRAGLSDTVAAALAPSGNALAWSTYLGGSGEEFGDGVAVDGSGSAYLVGHTSSSDFPTQDAVQPGFGGGEGNGEPGNICPCDAFVTKITPGGSLDYSTFLGGIGNDKARDIAVDADGRAHVIGFTLSSDFPVEGAFQDENRGPADGFVTSLGAQGDRIEYSTYLGGMYPDEAAGIDVDRCGNLYAAGYTPSPDFPRLRSFQGYNPGGTKEQNDGYVAKFDPERNLVYSTLLGGATYDGVFGVDVDPAGTAHVVGFTGSDNFPTVNAAQPAFGGATDAVVARITDEPCDPQSSPA